ncbi:hybrid sensor histidine kinase/response regulator [Desulfoferrobacter suflitae]|uniref:hybrid sensor histidine kinase/response regulator n=1 Tax=Desulfoferrobacter suflitae TaxID=2865782 RepID=UPI002164BCF7|nr:PAS domain S-box protein [Desulfoferrobacter suflitae]MCK8602735.1 PAS domain S-box protein [Desulfoferrobacter suflitae]
MEDDDKTRGDLIDELIRLRRRVAELEKKGAERTEAEQELAEIFSMSLDMICIADIHTATFIKVNPAFTNNLGWSEKELLKTPFVDFVHPEDVDATLRVIEEKLKKGEKIISFENRYRCKNGDCRWLSWVSHPVPERGITYAIAHDITARKQAEEKTLESEKEKAILNEIARVFLTVPDDRIYANVLTILLKVFHSQYGLFGFIGEGGDLVIPSLTGEIWSVCGASEKSNVFPRHSWGESLWGKAIREQQSIISDGPFKTPAGHVPIKNFMTVPVIFHGKTIGIFSAANNEGGFTQGDRLLLERIADYVSPILASRLQRDAEERDRKRAEKTLRDRERILQKIFDILPVGLWFVDKHGKLLRGNPRGIAIWGAEPLVSPDQYGVFKARRLPSGEEIAPDDWVLVHTIREGVTIENEMLEIDAFDGRKRIVLNYTAPLLDDDGTVQGAIVVNQDITEQTRTEAEKERLEAELRHSQKMEAIGTLAGGIAHEFNNILGIVLGNAELAREDIPDWNPARHHLDEIKSAAMRAKEVVRQLLTFSRRSEEQKRTLDLVPIIKEATRFLRSSIPMNIEFRMNMPAQCRSVEADSTQIHQILINLCSNAAHAMEDFGGILEFALADITLDNNSPFVSRELAPGDYVMLTITDTGCGIPPGILERIYDPYFTTKEVGKGTGMGLAIVHGIVENHGGSIQVESRPGKGTTFRIFFPAGRGRIQSQTVPAERFPAGAESILFVDDEESISNLCRLLLERLGYRVHSETSPVRALQIFAADPSRFDLVITDMTMPEMNGDRLLEEVLQIRPDVATILCTGYSERMDEQRARQIGAGAYALKPLNRAELARLVRMVLDDAPGRRGEIFTGPDNRGGDG